MVGDKKMGGKRVAYAHDMNYKVVVVSTNINYFLYLILPPN